MSRARKLLDQWDKGSSGRSFKMRDGERMWIRFLPGYDRKAVRKAEELGCVMDRKTGILIVRQHPWLPNIEGEPRRDGRPVITNYRCMRSINLPCGFCKFFENLPEHDRKSLYKHFSNPKMVVDLYVKSIGSIKRWFTGKENLEKIVQMFDFIPDLNDLEKGRFVQIMRSGSDMTTKYSFKPSQKVKPLEIDPEELPYILDELQNMGTPNEKKCRAILEAAFGTSDPSAKKVNKLSFRRRDEEDEKEED